MAGICTSDLTILNIRSQLCTNSAFHMVHGTVGVMHKLKMFRAYVKFLLDSVYISSNAHKPLHAGKISTVNKYTLNNDTRLNKTIKT